MMKPEFKQWLALMGLLIIAAATTIAEDFFEPYIAADRARVVVIENDHATDAFVSNSEVVQGMVNHGIMEYTGESDPSSAWQKLVRTNDVVGIKVFSSPGRVSGTRPVVVAGVINGLIASGLPSTNIYIWDKQVHELANAGYFELAAGLKTQIEGATTAGWDPEEYYDNPLKGALVWGDLEFGRKEYDVGRRSHLAQLVTKKITRIINVSPLLNHNQARVAGNLFSLASGSVDNFRRFDTSALRLETAIPEINALEALGDKVAINIVDALLCQYEGGQRALLHYSSRLNQLRFSRDPVALDVLSVHDLIRLREVQLRDNVHTNFTLFENAALLQLGVADTNKIDVVLIEE
jgi:hypothetical protein